MVGGAAGLGALLRNDEDPVPDAAGRRAAKDALRAFFKAVAAANMEALRAAISDDAVYEMPFSESGSTEPGRFRRFEGADQVIEFWRGTSGLGIQNLGAEDVELSILADGSRVFIEQRGHLIMPDGKEYRNRYVFRFDVRDGKVVHVREYLNPVISAYAFGRAVAQGIKIEAIG